jgi:hypothetical protein
MKCAVRRSPVLFHVKQCVVSREPDLLLVASDHPGCRDTCGHVADTSFGPCMVRAAAHSWTDPSTNTEPVRSPYPRSRHIASHPRTAPKTAQRRPFIRDAQRAAPLPTRCSARADTKLADRHTECAWATTRRRHQKMAEQPAIGTRSDKRARAASEIRSPRPCGSVQRCESAEQRAFR